MIRTALNDDEEEMNDGATRLQQVAMHLSRVEEGVPLFRVIIHRIYLDGLTGKPRIRPAPTVHSFYRWLDCASREAAIFPLRSAVAPLRRKRWRSKATTSFSRVWLLLRAGTAATSMRADRGPAWRGTEGLNTPACGFVLIPVRRSRRAAAVDRPVRCDRSSLAENSSRPSERNEDRRHRENFNRWC